MRFIWNKTKDAVNKDKHGISFQEACTCFEDPRQIVFFDPDHSDVEERELLIGYSIQGRLLLVSYTLRGRYVRIISARRATKRELKAYAQGI